MISYKYFELLLYLLVAFVFLAETLKSRLPVVVYEFLVTNKETIIGCYYLYLAFNVYNKLR